MDQGSAKRRQKQSNPGGTLRPELLRGIESRRLIGPTLDIYLNTLNQGLPQESVGNPSDLEGAD